MPSYTATAKAFHNGAKVRPGATVTFDKAFKKGEEPSWINPTPLGAAAADEQRKAAAGRAAAKRKQKKEDDAMAAEASGQKSDSAVDFMAAVENTSGVESL